MFLPLFGSGVYESKGKEERDTKFQLGAGGRGYCDHIAMDNGSHVQSCSGIWRDKHTPGAKLGYDLGT